MVDYFSHTIISSAPEQCDAIVECYLLNDCSCEIVNPQSIPSGDILQGGDADPKPVRTIETVCKICQQALRDADLIEGNYQIQYYLL